MNSYLGQIVDLVAGRIFPGRITVVDGRIAALEPDAAGESGPFLMPGLVDAHVHVESSLLTPAAFARLAVRHGTIAAVADPHEIANVLGAAGLAFMLRNAAATPFHFAFAAPSCVPATPFETAGAALTANDLNALFRTFPKLTHLGEMMNVPGVLSGDPEIRARLAVARRWNKPVDGHAPGLTGTDLQRYVSAGISTDHECTTLAEAREKAALGLKILIREGTAARDFAALAPLLGEVPDACMFCTDDLHPHTLLRGHIDGHVRRALALGFDPLVVLRAASLHPVRHYQLAMGLLQPGDPADFIVVDNLRDFKVLQTIIAGLPVHGPDAPPFLCPAAETPNQFLAAPKKSVEFALAAAPGATLRVIGVQDGSLLTAAESAPATVRDGAAVADPERDLLKLTVVNRYHPHATPAVAFVRGFGLKRGAIASSVAHDSHNIVAVGTRDEDLATAVNTIIQAKGGLALADGGRTQLLALPVAGLMSTAAGETVAAQYEALEAAAHDLGATLQSPFMALSFLALPVIPHLKLSDRGLFDGDVFRFVSPCE